MTTQTRPRRLLASTLAGLLLLGALALTLTESDVSRLAGIEREGDIPLPVALS